MSWPEGQVRVTGSVGEDGHSVTRNTATGGLAPCAISFFIFICLFVRTFKFYSLSKFQLCNTVLSTLVTMLYITSLDFIHLVPFCHNHNILRLISSSCGSSMLNVFALVPFRSMEMQFLKSFVGFANEFYFCNTY